MPPVQFPLLLPPARGILARPAVSVRPAARAKRMLINLLPDFFAVLASADRFGAYRRYFAGHERILGAYWRNYVLDPYGPHFEDVIRSTIEANWSDLRGMLERTDVVSSAGKAEARTRELLEADVDVDVVLMVGVGAANAGELVVDGRGMAFVCLEHFTGMRNQGTSALGLDPELLPLWLGHEIAHAVRYTSPRSRSALRALVLEAGGYYSYWDTAGSATLRELLVNEGIAVAVSRAVSPGHAEWQYFGYGRRQYARIRELEGVLKRTIAGDLGKCGLGLRLRYLSGGLSDEARTVNQQVLPERSGYFLGARLVEPAVSERGLAWSVRASAEEICGLARVSVA